MRQLLNASDRQTDKLCYNFNSVNTAAGNITVLIQIEHLLYDKYGTYDTGYRIAADYDLMLRLFYIDEGLFYPVYERIANFSLGGASASSSSEMEADLLRKKYGLMSSRKYTMRKIVRTVKKWLGY